MPRTACDYCYSKKEKCSFDASAQSCRFCAAHDQPCLFTRRERRMGRPPVVKKLPYGHSAIILRLDIAPADDTQHNSPSKKDASSSPEKVERSAGIGGLTTIPPAILTISPLSLASKKNQELVKALTDRQIFYTFHRNFMIGPSFSDQFRLSLQAILSCSSGSLLKAYRAVLAVWDNEGHRVRPLEEIDLSEGRDCLMSLGQVSGTSNLIDNAAILMLGQVLIVYHLFTTCTSAWTINRHAILSAARSYGDLLAQPIFDPISITPILFDTAESLVRRENPVIRLPQTDRFIVDRSVGLCWSLLGLLQELCEVSERMKRCPSKACRDTARRATGEEDDDLSCIEKKIRTWEPSAPSTLFDDFTGIEVAAMLTQARVYRITALLLIHRLRYPLGVEDEAARWHANMICADLTGFVSLAPEEIRGLPVGLPLLVAMLETREKAREIISGLALFAAHPQHLTELEKFVDLAWVARKGGFQGLWFDLVDVGLQMPVVP